MMTTNFTSLLETTFRRQYKFTSLNDQYILSNGKTNFTSLDNIIYPKCIRHILNIHCLCNVRMIFIVKSILFQWRQNIFRVL